jgi:hypothetical protein
VGKALLALVYVRGRDKRLHPAILRSFDKLRIRTQDTGFSLTRPSLSRIQVNEAVVRRAM